MIKGRIGVFETNSSTCHSLIIINLVDLEKWKRGGYIFWGNNKSSKVYTQDEARKIIRETIKEKASPEIYCQFVDELAKCENAANDWKVYSDPSWCGDYDIWPWTYKNYCEEHYNEKGKFKEFCIDGKKYAIFQDEYNC